MPQEKKKSATGCAVNIGLVVVSWESQLSMRGFHLGATQVNLSRLCFQNSLGTKSYNMDVLYIICVYAGGSVAPYCRGTHQYLVIIAILLLIEPHPAVTTKRLWWQ